MSNSLELDDLMKNFDELNKKVNEAKREMSVNSKMLVEKAAMQLFETTPEIEQVHWVQYTPHFNDGEPCEFSVHDICFKLQTDDEYDDNGYYDSSPIYTTDDLKEAKKDFESTVRFEKDPEEWRRKYRDDYVQRFKREPWNLERVRPYMDACQARREIDKIERFLENYPKGRTDTIKENHRKFESAMNKIPDDVMQSIYGDGVAVVITREGTDIEDFEHD